MQEPAASRATADELAEAGVGAPLAGVDVGTTLVKLALRDAAGLAFESHPRHDLHAVAERLRRHAAAHVVLTGGGAPQLERELPVSIRHVGEVEAWGRGGRRLLELAEGGAAPRFLLVSMGTGTSVMLVEGERVLRVGGTALGGGTIMGLGAVLFGESRFEAIAGLARAGDRRRVDLLISDVYPDSEFLLPPHVNAASFARLARPGTPPPGASDLAHGLMGLVGENVALICCGLAAATGVERIVFGGSTLRDNPSLATILEGAVRALGRRPTCLERGEFAGALGALEQAPEGAPGPTG